MPRYLISSRLRLASRLVNDLKYFGEERPLIFARSEIDSSFIDQISSLSGQNIRLCSQCSQCTSSCPISYVDSFNIRELIRERLFERERESIGGLSTYLASEGSLARNWNSPEEDEAWAHLQKEK